MKKIFVSGLFLTGIILPSSCNNGTKNETGSKEAAKQQNERKFEDKPMENDAKFVVEAADGGMMEVKLGKLALTNAASPAVKQLGQRMIDDHGKANAELKTLAASKNISVPDTLSERKRDKYNYLAMKKGADFDRAYTGLMVDDHKEDIEAFKKEAEKGNDTAIKEWAAGKLSTLERHLQMVESAMDAVKRKEPVKDSLKKK